MNVENRKGRAQAVHWGSVGRGSLSRTRKMGRKPEVRRYFFISWRGLPGQEGFRLGFQGSAIARRRASSPLAGPLPGSSSPLTGHYHRGPDNRDEEERNPWPQMGLHQAG